MGNEYSTFLRTFRDAGGIEGLTVSCGSQRPTVLARFKIRDTFNRTVEDLQKMVDIVPITS
jgi:hypothetical protein